MTPEEYPAYIIPVWLGRAMALDELPWEQALTTTMPEFLAEYTLHDSQWRGLVLHPNQYGVLCLLWDAYWAQGKVPDFGGIGPFLFFRFRIQRVDIAMSDRILSDATSTLHAPNERIYRTRFISSGSETEVLHSAAVQILCLDVERNIVSIPMPIP